MFPRGTNLLFSRCICPSRSRTSLERFWKCAPDINQDSDLYLTGDKRPVPSQTETVVVVPICWRVPIAIRRTAVVIIVVPRAAPQNPRTKQACPFTLSANIAFCLKNYHKRILKRIYSLLFSATITKGAFTSGLFDKRYFMVWTWTSCFSCPGLR